MKTTGRILGTAVLLAMACGTLQAARHTLSIEDCRQRALQYNLGMQMSQVQSEAAEATQQGYKAKFFPSLTFSSALMYGTLNADETIKGGYLPTFAPDASGQLQPQITGLAPDGTPIFAAYAYMPDISLSLKMNTLFFGGLQLQQPIYMGGKVQTAYRMASTGVRMAALSEALQRDEVILQSDKAYYQCVEARAMLTSLQQYNAMLDELARVVSNAVDAGMVQRKDLLSVQVRQNEAVLQQQRASNGVRLATMNLCHIIGLPLTDEIEVSSEFMAAPLVDHPAHDVSRRTEYALLSEQMNLKAYEADLEKGELRPQVGLMAMYGYGNGMKLNGDKLLDGGNFLAALRVSVPIVHAGEGRHKVSAADAERRKAELQREDMAQQMSLEMMKAGQAYEEALQEVELTRKAVEQAEENLKVSQNRYTAGEEMMTDLLEAQTLWQKSEADHITAQSALGLARTVYLKALGQL
ncbi:MAG: TolC family protein [Bacteroidales bacterium]|nr:TolC family protein [Bacteroidales bacterium]